MITISALALSAVVFVSVMIGAILNRFAQWLDDNFWF